MYYVFFLFLFLVLQEDLKTFPFRVTRSADGGILVNLDYEKDGSEMEQKSFTPEQLLAMLFVNLKGTGMWVGCVCMYIYVLVCVCVYMYIGLFVCVCVCGLSTYVLIYVYICMCAYTQMHAYMHVE